MELKHTIYDLFYKSAPISKIAYTSFKEIISRLIIEDDAMGAKEMLKDIVSIRVEGVLYPLDCILHDVKLLSYMMRLKSEFECLEEMGEEPWYDTYISIIDCLKTELSKLDIIHTTDIMSTNDLFIMREFNKAREYGSFLDIIHNKFEDLELESVNSFSDEMLEYARCSRLYRMRTDNFSVN